MQKDIDDTLCRMVNMSDILLSMSLSFWQYSMNRTSVLCGTTGPNLQ